MTSPAAADGKSTVVGWLARSLALSGEEVVAVDLDLRKPELHAYLNTTREPGAGVLDALLAAAPDDNGDPRAAPCRGTEGRAPGGSASRRRRTASRPRGRRVYTDDDVTAGLVELARFGGQRAPRRSLAQGRGPRHPRVHPAQVEGHARRALCRDPLRARQGHGRGPAPAAADRAAPAAVGADRARTTAGSSSTQLR